MKKIIDIHGEIKEPHNIWSQSWVQNTLIIKSVYNYNIALGKDVHQQYEVNYQSEIIEKSHSIRVPLK